MRLGLTFPSSPCLLLIAVIPALLVSASPASASEHGRRLYLSQCAACHGPEGEGGKGPSLARPRLRHAPDDESLALVIRRGIPGTEMPSTWLSLELAREIASYVRTLGRIEQPPLPGDPARGRRIYEAKGGCTNCHNIEGRGAALGPALDDIGARRSAAHLREALLEPEVFVPANYLQVRAAPRSGPPVTGGRVNEDSFSIQIRDADGRVHSFWKRDLEQLSKRYGRSPMPAYAAYSSEEIDDLVAYLASLQGE